MKDMGLSGALPIPTNYSETPLTAECPNEVIVQQNFDQPNILLREIGFEGGMGANATIIKGSYDNSSMLAVRHRYQVWQGPSFDVTSIRSCLSSDFYILFSAKVKLLPNGTSPNATLSRCKSVCCKVGDGTGCPTLKATYMAQDGKTYRTTLVKTDPHDIVNDGFWFPLTGMFKLSTFILDPSNYYLSFSVTGVEMLIDIYIDDIVMKYPPSSSFVPASQACANLAFGGDAELLPVFSYPMYSFVSDSSGGLLRTIDDPTTTNGNNHVFRLVGRSGNFNGLAFSINPQCVPASSVYFFSARLFLNNTQTDYSNTTNSTPAKNPDIPLVMMKKKANNQTTFIPITTCPAANASIGWVRCQGFYTFKAGDSDAESLQVSFMMMTDKTSDILYDDVSFTFVSGGVGSPQFGGNVGACWDTGASVYLASQSMNATAGSVLKITGKNVTGDNTTMKFDKPVDAVPLSKSIDFATEFALLGRNIHFESEDLTNPANGAYLTILSTLSIPQLLQGVTFNGFGQQGIANRFPIFFKSCGDSSGSVVSKNAIINSNQRCIVLQNTNGVSVTDNVAYNTAGHCYSLEDGSEMNNTFEGNFGAGTTAAKVVISGESDNNPATFFITNPNNFFKGNIAAGSSDTGFYFSLGRTVSGESAPLFPNLNPSVQPLGLFTDNVAHSNALSGIKTWPSAGYSPLKMASLINSKVFRNRGTGLNLQGGQKLTVQGGVFADNRIAVSVNTYDDVVVRDTKIVGYSRIYGDAVILNRMLSPPCPSSNFRLYGVLVNGNAKNTSLPGTRITNVTFSEFDSSSTCPGFAVGVSGSSQSKSFTSKLSLSNLTFDPASDMKLNTCDAAFAGVIDVVVADTGALNPSGNGTAGFVYNVNATVFGKTCSNMPDTCSMYCIGDNDASSALVSKLSVSTSFSGTDTVALEILTPDGNAFTVQGSVGSGDTLKDSLFTVRRMYFASVPPGTYTARFKDANDMIVWPAFGVELVNGFKSSNFTIERPITTCAKIVPNGDFSAPLSSSGWYHMGGGLQYVTGNPGNALATVKRADWSDGLGTFLDSRCLQVGLSYEVMADVQLVLTAGGSATCDPLLLSGDNVCPRGDLIALNNGVITSAVWGVASLGGPTGISPGWNSLYGIITITPELAAADQVFFQVDRVRPGVEIQIDNVIFSKISIGCDLNMVKNSGVDYGNFALWGTMGKPTLKIVSPGAPDSTGKPTYYALSAGNRTQWHFGPSQDLNVSCFKVDEQYVVEMDVKMEDNNGNAALCNPYQMTTTRPDACPMVFLKMTQGNDTKISAKPIATTYGPYNETKKWRKIYNVFKATADIANAAALSFFVGAGMLNRNIVIDNVVVRKASLGDFNLTCSNLIRNGDLSVGDARLYAIFGEGYLAMDKPGADGTGYALVHKNRTKYWHGPVNMLDNSCWKLGEQWSFSVNMRIRNAATGAWATCDKAAKFGNTWCPTPIIYSVNPTGNLNLMTTVTQSSQYNSTPWNANGWNTFTGSFTVVNEMVNYPYVWGYIGNEMAGIDLYLDDWKITKIG